MVSETFFSDQTIVQNHISLANWRFVLVEKFRTLFSATRYLFLIVAVPKMFENSHHITTKTDILVSSHVQITLMTEINARVTFIRSTWCSLFSQIFNREKLMSFDQKIVVQFAGNLHSMISVLISCNTPKLDEYYSLHNLTSYQKYCSSIDCEANEIYFSYWNF